MISQAVSSLRVGRRAIRRFRQQGSWGLRLGGQPGSGFHLVLDGSAWLISADAPPIALRPGDVVLVPAGADHGLSITRRALHEMPLNVMNLDQSAPGPADFEFLCGSYRLDHGQVHPYLTGMPDLIVVSPDHERHPEWRSLISLLVEGESLAQPGTEVTRSALLDLMLVSVLRQWLEEKHPKGRPTITDPAIVTALDAIHDSPRTQWTVSRLGEMVGMSRTTFTRRFTSQVGKPPMTYLIGWRLNCAARLLRETDASLAAIARQVGYSTEFAFAGAFRREYGVSPGRFRQAAGVPDQQARSGS
ncbi:AraC family transcriptional regulator [Nonomuraea wenchangensis]|uniref:AraC-type DNA-binding protein n=1 Tax=Nonomuraea wenchangensis TaxID=568860 RepID=A0A1I0LAN3_9ACTN|nr:AraC family transcriptional regulator [Nonomuraea wenchangensis]SEU37013.1 AraC-type DNA-binding protein [Nonomuraea wenchangensis]